MTVFSHCRSFCCKLALVNDASTAAATAVVDYRMLQLH
jgi:hypothetical protein